MTETVSQRIDEALIEVTPARLAAGLGLLLLVGAALLFAQEPLVHDTMHNFRHGAGIVCH